VSRYKHYIPETVLDEAKKRIHHIYDTFDSVAVCFSGGKDSLVVMHLMKEVAEERGEGPFLVVFRDEELIHPSVAKFMESYRDLPWCDLEWWTVPLSSTAYLLGRNIPIVQWDEERNPDMWARERPEWGLKIEDLGLPAGTILDQHFADEIAARNLPGKVALITGVRAAEGLMRYRSCVNKLSENYLVASTSRRMMLARPIFDWQENDVFRYLWENDIAYAPIYDAQTWGKRELRVSSALPPETSKLMHKLKAIDPDLYEMVARVFPHVEIQSRYSQDLNKQRLIDKYAHSWEGLREFIDVEIEDEKQKRVALLEFRATYVRATNDPDAYPLDYVLKAFINNGGIRRVMPMIRNSKPEVKGQDEPTTVS